MGPSLECHDSDALSGTMIVQIRNNGPLDAINASLVHELPLEITYNVSTPLMIEDSLLGNVRNGSSCVVMGHTLSCHNFGTIFVNQTIWILFGIHALANYSGKIASVNVSLIDDPISLEQCCICRGFDVRLS
jgi:hypothetical protein